MPDYIIYDVNGNKNVALVHVAELVWNDQDGMEMENYSRLYN